MSKQAGVRNLTASIIAQGKMENRLLCYCATVLLCYCATVLLCMGAKINK